MYYMMLTLTWREWIDIEKPTRAWECWKRVEEPARACTWRRARWRCISRRTKCFASRLLPSRLSSLAPSSRVVWIRVVRSLPPQSSVILKSRRNEWRINEGSMKNERRMNEESMKDEWRWRWKERNGSESMFMRIIYIVCIFWSSFCCCFSVSLIVCTVVLHSCFE